jgi:hypothetical protein
MDTEIRHVTSLGQICYWDLMRKRLSGYRNFTETHQRHATAKEQLIPFFLVDSPGVHLVVHLPLPRTRNTIRSTLVARMVLRNAGKIKLPERGAASGRLQLLC